jgi:aminopeptidase N
VFQAETNLSLIHTFSSEYKSVTSQHLINAFKEVMTELGVTTFDFEQAFRSWEKQSGYPYIDVNFDSGRFNITQRRFTTQKSSEATQQSTWQIPINFVVQSKPNFDDTNIVTFMTKGQDMINAPSGHTGDHWYIFNTQQLGYYRVNYDMANWKALAKALNSEDFGKIHVLNRAQLLDDSINLATGGYLDYQVMFDIMEYLNEETDYAPWASLEIFFNELYSVFGESNEFLNVRVN